MLVNGDCNWLNLLNDTLATYNSNQHSNINMTPVDASINPEKFRRSFMGKAPYCISETGGFKTDIIRSQIGVNKS